MLSCRPTVTGGWDRGRTVFLGGKEAVINVQGRDSLLKNRQEMFEKGGE